MMIRLRGFFQVLFVWVSTWGRAELSANNSRVGNPISPITGLEESESDFNLICTLRARQTLERDVFELANGNDAMQG